MRKLLIGSMMALSVSGFAQNVVFNPFDNFADGALDGQDGFIVQTAVSGSHLVGPSGFAVGTKNVNIDTGPLGIGNWAWQDFTGFTPSAGHTIIVSQVLGTVETDPLDRPGSGVGLDAYQLPFARMAGIVVYADGGSIPGEVDLITGDNGENVFVHPTFAPTTGQTYLITICMDLTAGTACGFVNDTELAVTTPLPMMAWGGGSTFTDSDLWTIATGYNMVHYDNQSIDAVLPGTIRGQVILGDYAGAYAGTPIVVEIRDAAGASILDTKTGVLDASGTFQVATSVRGTVTVAVKASHWLNKLRTTTSNLTNFGIYGLTYTLLNGDINDDNGVDIGDYAILSSAYNTFNGDPGFVPNADLNGDDEVGISDYAILSQNYNLLGD